VSSVAEVKTRRRGWSRDPTGSCAAEIARLWWDEEGSRSRSEGFRLSLGLIVSL